jgi:uncharacterized protein YdaU (DUF1376 family)
MLSRSERWKEKGKGWCNLGVLQYLAQQKQTTKKQKQKTKKKTTTNQKTKKNQKKKTKTKERNSKYLGVCMEITASSLSCSLTSSIVSTKK